MTARQAGVVLVAALLSGVPTLAQAPDGAPASTRFVDTTNGLALAQAIDLALAQEPSLLAARSEVELARGMRRQAGLRPNPAVSFEQREEPGGTDSQTAVAVTWPLDLFRRAGRVEVADREVEARERAAADRERMLAAEVRARYGRVLAAVRHLAVLDELVAATRRQRDVLRSQVDEGATPAVDRDLMDVELRRLESDRLLLAGEAEVALFELKRALGMQASSPLAVSDTLEAAVRREAAAPRQIADASGALDQRTDVREARARVDLAEAKIARARADGRLDVSLFASYMRMDAGFPQRGIAADGTLHRIRGLFHYVSAGAMVTLPLLDRNQGAIAAARAERAGAAAESAAVRLTADMELAAARARDEHARQAVGAYDAGTRDRARANLAVVGQSYELGRVSIFDVLAEQRRYLDVERAYTEALRAAFEARTALDLALGGVR